MPIIGLAYLLGGPIGALAVLVPRLGAHRRKAQELHRKVEKAMNIEPAGDDTESSDETREKLQAFLAAYVVLNPLEERVLRLTYGIGVTSRCSDAVISEQLSINSLQLKRVRDAALKKLAHAGLSLEGDL